MIFAIDLRAKGRRSWAAAMGEAGSCRLQGGGKNIKGSDAFLPPLETVSAGKAVVDSIFSRFPPQRLTRADCSGGGG